MNRCVNFEFDRNDGYTRVSLSGAVTTINSSPENTLRVSFDEINNNHLLDVYREDRGLISLDSLKNCLIDAISNKYAANSNDAAALLHKKINFSYRYDNLTEKYHFKVKSPKLMGEILLSVSDIKAHLAKQTTNEVSSKPSF